MGWRFRKSFSPLPGVRLTLSPRGISTSVGAGPLRFTVGPQGQAVTMRVPGTGVAFRMPISTSGTRPSPVGTAPSNVAIPHAGAQAQEVKSGDSEMLTSPGLAEFKRLLEEAHREHGAIIRELKPAREQERAAVDRLGRWQQGWLFRRIFKTAFARLAATAETATALRVELEEQEALARLQTQFDLPLPVEKAFHRLRDEFAALSKAERIWDTVGERATNTVAERTTAALSVERKAVTFELSKCNIIESAWTVPRLGNANGGDLYLYPGFLLYFVSQESFALLEYSQIKLHCGSLRFHETETVPADAEVVGQTWHKANKDGSRDLRFAANFQLPVVRYAQLTITSATGLHEKYLVSKAALASAFDDAWTALVSAGMQALDEKEESESSADQRRP